MMNSPRNRERILSEVCGINVPRKASQRVGSPEITDDVAAVCIGLLLIQRKSDCALQYT